MINVADYAEVGALSEVDAIDIGAEASKMEAPGTWHARYSEQDQIDVAAVIAWLNASGRTQSWLSRVSRVNSGTLNQVLKGAYGAPPGKFLGAMLDAIRVQDERAGHRGIPFVETSVWQLAGSVYHRARTYRNLGVFSGYVGTGKTTAAQEYARRTSNVHLVECMRNMSASAFLDELCIKLNLAAEARGGSKEKKFFLVVRALKGSDTLIIVDEAETIHPETLHYIRRIRDMAQVGIVLQGTEELGPLIRAERGRFDQIRSRVGFWPATVQSIQRHDCDEVALAAFEDLETPPDSDTLDAIWAVCGGSIRLLTEALIPAIRDYGFRKGRSLNVALVRQIAAEVLKMSVGGGRGKP